MSKLIFVSSPTVPVPPVKPQLLFIPQARPDDPRDFTPGKTLSTDGGLFSGADSYTYQWGKDGSVLPGETSPSYVIQAPLNFQTAFWCKVKATNSAGFVETVGISTEFGPPYASTIPLITGGGAVGNTISSDKGTWINGSGPFFTFIYILVDWYRNDKLVKASPGNIPSQLLYTITPADVGKYIYSMASYYWTTPGSGGYAQSTRARSSNYVVGV